MLGIEAIASCNAGKALVASMYAAATRVHNRCVIARPLVMATTTVELDDSIVFTLRILAKRAKQKQTEYTSRILTEHAQDRLAAEPELAKKVAQLIDAVKARKKGVDVGWDHMAALDELIAEENEE